MHVIRSENFFYIWKPKHSKVKYFTPEYLSPGLIIGPLSFQFFIQCVLYYDASNHKFESGIWKYLQELDVDIFQF